MVKNSTGIGLNLTKTGLGTECPNRSLITNTKADSEYMQQKKNASQLIESLKARFLDPRRCVGFVLVY